MKLPPPMGMLPLRVTRAEPSEAISALTARPAGSMPVMGTVVSNLRIAMPTLFTVAASVKFIDVPPPSRGTSAVMVQSTLAADAEQGARTSVAPPVRVNTGAGGLTHCTKPGSHGEPALGAQGVLAPGAFENMTGSRPLRSEERRVGEESDYRWLPCYCK